MSRNEEEFSMHEEACDVCGEQAIVVLTDCQHREPQKAPNGHYYQRIKRHGRRRALCQKHIRPPRLFGPNGKLIEEISIPGV